MATGIVVAVNAASGWFGAGTRVHLDSGGRLGSSVDPSVPVPAVVLAVVA
jgi:hypothetical protein